LYFLQGEKRVLSRKETEKKLRQNRRKFLQPISIDLGISKKCQEISWINTFSFALAVLMFNS